MSLDCEDLAATALTYPSNARMSHINSVSAGYTTLIVPVSSVMATEFPVHTVTFVIRKLRMPFGKRNRWGRRSARTRS